VLLLFVNELMLPRVGLSICNTFQMMRKYEAIC